MAVERLTDYTRRIWTALDADAPEGHDFEVGDVIYYMDSSQCGIVTYVYPEGSIDVEFLPDIGGGGGGDTVEYIDVTVRAINNTGTGRLPVYYWTETDGVLGCTAVALELNTNVTMHTQVINGNVQLTAQSSTVGWIPYYNNEPLELLNNSNRSLGFKLPPEYTPGEIITIIH